ncbi:hypothetical protein [Massilia yuzhufengensis]|uniref:hypothetical protein n=1 Tax=Massilia yuzhufengensis TaxID=1164594 RepID=UPI001160309B|nr:hypothetical protein [Massilia yuzhufengensis]
MKKAIHVRSIFFIVGWALIGSFLPMSWVWSQSQLPPPNRTIYKCQIKGTISYSDEPCVGAQRLDATPTRGVNRLSGSARTGRDVSNEVRSEQIAQSIRPLTGMNAAQFATAVRRHPLDAATQRECHQLEPAILKLEQAERHPSAVIGPIQKDLFVLRKQYQKLGC